MSTNSALSYTSFNTIFFLQEMNLFVQDPMELQLANNYRADLFADLEESSNHNMRHGNYWQFVLWRHGRLGAGGGA